MKENAHHLHQKPNCCKYWYRRHNFSSSSIADRTSMPDTAISAQRLNTLCENISPLDPRLLHAGQEHVDSLAKPLGSLGRLEEIASRLFAINRGIRPLHVAPARLFTVAGDHGVYAEGVGCAPQEVTRLQVLNFLRGGGGINCICAACGAELLVVDAGVAGDEFDDHPRLIKHRIAPGTANIATGPAMTEEQCLDALLFGASLAEQAKNDGCAALAIGEMGIANTTPSSALYCAWLGLPPEKVVGPGAGIPHVGLAGKATVIRKSLDVNAEAVDSGSPLKILAALGGFEIAVMAGIILGAGAQRLPVAIDGFIATASFVAARAMAPQSAGYCFLSHTSAEPGHMLVMERLGEKPYLNLDMRLGEATGAAIALVLLRSAAIMFNNMDTFASLGVTAG